MIMTDHVPPPPAQPNSKQVEFWVCDVCKVEKFKDFDMACRHEEACKKRKLAETDRTSTSTSNKSNTNSNAKISHNNNNNKTTNKVHPFFAAPTATATTGENAAGVKSGTTKRRKTEDNADAVPIDSNPTFSIENNNSKQQLKENAAQSGSSSSNEVSAHPFFSSKKKPQHSKQQQPSKSKAKSAVAAAAAAVDQDDNEDAVKVVGVVKPKASKATTKNSTAKSKANKTPAASKSSNDNSRGGPLASLFLKDNNGDTTTMICTKQLMAEQVAAEFQAKRRLQREQEKERQRKRQEHFLSQQEKASKAKAKKVKEEFSRFSCPAFPVPSFLPLRDDTIGSSLPERPHVWLDDEHLKLARLSLRKSLPFPGKANLDFTTEGPSDFSYFDAQPQSRVTDSIIRFESTTTIQMELAKVLVPPTHHLPFDLTSEKPQQHVSNTLWVDKYPLTVENICGAQNQEVSQKMISFVQEWMIERQKANQRMAERQKALQKKKKKKKYKDDDEAMWSDLESDDDENKLPSVCLLEGPLGSGKSSLVHAVAKYCDCQLLELNTSDKRGSVDLRKALEEATQSHSSLDMLKKQQASLFAKQELVDSDDEGNDDDDGEHSKNKKGASLSVILIDEVDNIFESQGDTAFWSALNDLTRKAKCPVFLTTNAFPRGLVASSMRYRHERTVLPTPLECALKMKQLCQKEGLHIRQPEGNGLDDLTAVAELGGCDIRRIMHELQLFSSIQEPRGAGSGAEMVEPPQTNPELTKSTSTIPSVLVLESVSPKMVPSSLCSLLTIKGKGFQLLCSSTTSREPIVNVFVGDQRCPTSAVVDDETILVVCPPCSPPGYVDSIVGTRRTSTAIGRRSSPDARFAPLSLQSCPTAGSFPISSTSIVSHSLLDDEAICVISSCNIEYSFPELPHRVTAQRDNDDESISECEFDETDALANSEWNNIQASFLTKRRACGDKTVDEVTCLEEANQQFNKELQRLKALGENSQFGRDTQSGSVRVNKELGDTLETLAMDLHLASDASMLSSHVGVPFLTGSSPGFGYRYTPEGSDLSAAPSKLSRHGNSTQCSEERLISLGWKDSAAFYGDSDAYMSHLVSARERKLLQVAETSGRRILSSLEDLVAAPACDPKDEASDDEQDLTMWSPLDSKTSEEDFLLARPTPVPLLGLPSILINATKVVLSTPPYWQHGILEHRREARADELVALVDNIVCSDAGPKMFCRGLHRFSLAFLPNEFDSTLFLEYLPIWRNMAVHERAAGSIAPEGGNAGTSRRRATRMTAKKGRSHYFELLNHLAFHRNDDNTAAEVGKQLAASWLHSGTR